MKTRLDLPECLVGTSGWSYKHWAGIFYPGWVKPDRYLEYYTTKFSCVELNSSFYHLPKECTVDGWVQRTPESFRFCPKLSRYITHQKKLVGCFDALDNYFKVICRLKEKTGPVLIQLPPGISYDRAVMETLCIFLNKQYPAFRFAIEVRHPSWITDAFFQLLTCFNISFVLADSGNRFLYHEMVTTDFVYLRLHGPGKSYASGYDTRRLDQIATMIRKWMDGDLDVWVFFNNDLYGHAIHNALELLDILSLKIK